jgi:hypothetical protein
MRTWLALSLLVVAAGCGKKSTPAPAAPPTPAAVAPEPEPEPEPEEPAEPEAPPSNASFSATLTHANGSTIQGKVVRVERGDDWYAEDGWIDTAGKLKLAVESGSTMDDRGWDQIATIDIKYGGRDALDCQYDSAFTPWMYMCVLRTTSTAKDSSGKSWSVTTRNKWKFTFADGNEVEFYVHKLPVRRQDDKSMGLDSVENYDLYGELQAEAMEMAKSAVTKIVITK